MLLKQQLVVHDTVLSNTLDFYLCQVVLDMAMRLKVVRVREDFLNHYC